MHVEYILDKSAEDIAKVRIHLYQCCVLWVYVAKGLADHVRMPVAGLQLLDANY